MGNEDRHPDFIEKRFHWGLCYGMLDTKRMAAVIIQASPDARAHARAILAEVKDGQIRKDEYTRQIEVYMRCWGLNGTE